MYRGTVRFVIAACVAALSASLATQAQQPTSTPTVPNLLIEVSLEFANAAGSQLIDQVDPIQESKGRMHLTGASHTRGTVLIDLVPSAQQGIIDLLLQGGTDANTTARQGKVYLNLSTGISFHCRKRISFDVDGIRACASEPFPRLEYNVLNCIGTDFRGPLDPLVRKIAHRVYLKQKPKVERETVQGAGKTLAGKMDEMATERLAKANQAYLQDVRQPLEKRGVFPQRIRVMTSDHQLGIRALLLDPAGKSQSFNPVPEIHGWPDIAVRIEETLLNNGAQANFAGKRFTGEELDAEFNALLKPFLTEPIKTTDPEDKGFSITFPKQKPIEFHFENGGFRITLRGEEYTSGGREFDGMDTTAVYKLTKTAKGLTAERVGNLIIFPPGFDPTKNKLGLRETTLRKLLERKFGRIFKEKFEINEIVLPEGLAKVGSLVTTQVEANKGWLVLAWRRVPPEQTPPPAKAIAARE